jgi:hypothetical protein
MRAMLAADAQLLACSIQDARPSRCRRACVDGEAAGLQLKSKSSGGETLR